MTLDLFVPFIKASFNEEELRYIHKYSAIHLSDSIIIVCSPSDPIVIYGRHLNPTKLSNVSSLYSVGREWVRNDPYGHRIDEVMTNNYY